MSSGYGNGLYIQCYMYEEEIPWFFGFKWETYSYSNGEAQEDLEFGQFFV